MLLIDAIAHIESCGKNIAGDHGAALSIFQIHREAWEDVKKRFGDPKGTIYLNVGERFEDIATTNRDLRMFARNCATGYAFILEERLKRFGHEPSPENVYACWNLGFNGFKHRHFNLNRCPRITVFKARQVAALVKSQDPPKKSPGHD
jgi:hypothetical protein